MTEAAGTQQQHFRELAVARTTYCLPTSRLRLFFHLSFEVLFLWFIFNLYMLLAISIILPPLHV